jgi:hypothetical protein
MRDRLQKWALENGAGETERPIRSFWNRQFLDCIGWFAFGEIVEFCLRSLREFIAANTQLPVRRRASTEFPDPDSDTFRSEMNSFRHATFVVACSLAE